MRKVTKKRRAATTTRMVGTSQKVVRSASRRQLGSLVRSSRTGRLAKGGGSVALMDEPEPGEAFPVPVRGSPRAAASARNCTIRDGQVSPGTHACRPAARGTRGARGGLLRPCSSRLSPARGREVVHNVLIRTADYSFRVNGEP